MEISEHYEYNDYYLFDKHFSKIGSDLIISDDLPDILTYDVDISKLDKNVVGYTYIHEGLCNLITSDTDWDCNENIKNLKENYYNAIIYELFSSKHSILQLNTCNWKIQKDIIDNISFF